jgi:hypothetical protein
MTNRPTDFTIQLVDADPQQKPLAGFKARIALLDRTDKEVKIVFDSYSDDKGRVSFRIPITESKEEPSLLHRIAICLWKWLIKGSQSEARSVRDRAALPQKIKLEVSGVDGPIYAQTIRLEPNRNELTVSVPVADYEKKLTAPLDDFLVGIDTELSAQLKKIFREKEIETLEDVRRDKTVEADESLDDQDRKQLEFLKSHARLRLVSRDPKTIQTLINAGYADLFAIASKSEIAFVNSLKGILTPQSAAQLYFQVQTKLAILRNISTEQRIYRANGYVSSPTFAQTAGTDEQPPCECNCQSALSPLAYLADLLDYTRRNAHHCDDELTPDRLEELFFQPFGDLPDDCAASETLCRQVRLCIEVLRERGGVDDDIIKEHLQRTYDALLAEMGTSRRELRLVRGNSKAQQALVERLGTALPGTDPVKGLDRLRLDPNSSDEGQKLTEENLEVLFGFQDTSRDRLSTGAKPNDEANQLSRWRFNGIEWGYNTSQNGKIYATLIRDGSTRELKLYTSESLSADTLVASGSRNSSSGEIMLETENESGLSGRVEFSYQGDDDTLVFAVVPELLSWRLASLHEAWKSQDADDDKLPIIDPDQLSAEWIRNNRNGDKAQQLLSQRANELSRIFFQVRLNTANADQLKARLSENSPIILDGTVIHHPLKFTEAELNAALQGAKPLPFDLERHGVTEEEAAALIETLRYARTGEADDEDWVNARHILTQAEKRRILFLDWREQEEQAGITLSPVFFRFPTNFRSPASPPSLSLAGARWRFSPTQQKEWRDKLANRIDQQNNVVSGWQKSIDNVEERILPTLRNDIINDVIPDLFEGPSLADKQDWVTNHLLINASEGSCRKTTRVAQAIETLQLLLWGLRTKNIEAWSLTLSAEHFDEEWRWLGTFASWQSAMLVFLYPELLLAPRLRNEEDQSKLFKAFVKVLDGYTPSEPDDEEDDDESPQDEPDSAPPNEVDEAAKLLLQVFNSYLTGGQISPSSAEGAKRLYEVAGFLILPDAEDRETTPSEKAYYLPVHIALMFQKQGDYITALDWFSRVYDYRTGELNANVEEIFAERVTSSLVQRYENWRRDVDNPHRIAATRTDADLRFILISIIRCLLDYAEAEFTIDTAESLAHVRELYLTAHRLLRKDELNQGAKDCPEILGALVVKIGDDQWVDIVLNIVVDVLGANLGRAGNLVGLDDMIDDIRKVIDEQNQLVPEQRRRIRETVAGYLPPPRPGTIEGRLAMSAFKERVEINRLLQDRAVFNTVQKVESGAMQSQITFGQTLNFSTLGTATVATGAGMSGLWVRAPKFEFCIPKNPLLRLLNLRISSGQFKLQNCQNIAGMQREYPVYAASANTQSWLPSINADGRVSFGSPVQLRPTQYRYRALIERARQLAGTAQQMEGSYLSFLDRADQERYNLLKAGHELELANANVRLQDFRVAEANQQKELADLQQTKVEFIRDHYGDLLETPINGLEALSLASLESAVLLLTASAAASYVASGIQAAYGAAQLTATSGLAGWNEIAGSYSSLAASLSTAASAASTQSSVFSMLASFERRAEEWQFQKDLAELHDLEIAKKQVDLAEAHIDIVGQERAMARIGADNASATVTFLQNKFTNIELYDWMSGIVGDTYHYFLQQATAVAKLAQTQLAFERQEPEAGFILGDYSTARSEEFLPNENEPDRRGLTGSARLLQDITRLDQQAFLSDRRKLQLSKTISLQRFDPIIFQQFRQSGSLLFNTNMEIFDRDFPGHYLRLIKRVRVSIIALIPPTEGIKATLSTVGVSKVVPNEALDAPVDVLRPPDSVALTSPINATGVFELQEQSEMLLPFEGGGVDWGWNLRLPKAANLFDYSTIADVLFTIEYTALEGSTQYRSNVISRFNSRVTSQRPFSFRQNFADAWYDFHHPELVEAPNRPMTVGFETTRADFPPNINNLKIQYIALYVARKDSAPFEVTVSGLNFTEQESNSTTSAGAATTLNGVISTLSRPALSWSNLAEKSPIGKWVLALPDEDLVKELFRTHKIEDILFVITLYGEQAEWR